MESSLSGARTYRGVTQNNAAHTYVVLCFPARPWFTLNPSQMNERIGRCPINSLKPMTDLFQCSMWMPDTTDNTQEQAPRPNSMPQTPSTNASMQRLSNWTKGLNVPTFLFIFSSFYINQCWTTKGTTKGTTKEPPNYQGRLQKITQNAFNSAANGAAKVASNTESHSQTNLTQSSPLKELGLITRKDITKSR